MVDFVGDGRSLGVDPSVLGVGFVSLGASVSCFAVSDPEGAFLVVIFVDDFVLGAGDFVGFRLCLGLVYLSELCLLPLRLDLVDLVDLEDLEDLASFFKEGRWKRPFWD